MKSPARIFLCILSVVVASAATGDVGAPNSLETLEKQLLDLKSQVHELQTKVVQNQERDPGLDYVERCESGVVTTTHSMYGSGIRTQDLSVLFSRPFRTTPVVTYGLRNLDQGHTGSRVTVSGQSVSTTGLIVRLGTFADSVLYGAAVGWMACA